MFVKDYAKWHLPKGAKLRLGKGYINEITYSPDSSRLAVASSIGIWVYDAETGEELDLFTGHTVPVERLSYSPDGRFIASSTDKTVHLWDAVTGEQKAILNHDNNVSNFVYSPDGNTITTESQEKVYLWNAVTGEQKVTLTESLYNDWFFSFAYSPDGRTIATVSYGEVCLWDAVTGERKVTLTGESFTYSPDSHAIATWKGEEIYLWDAVTGERKTTFTNVGNVESFAYSPDGRTIATISCGEVCLWDVVTGKHEVRLIGESFTYSPDGHAIATWKGEEIYLWDAVTGERKTTLLIDTGINYNYSQSLRGVSLEYSPDGRTIAALIPIDCMLDDDAEMECLMVCLWDTSTGELKASGLDGTGGVEYSFDSGTIALKSANMNSMTLRDVVTGERKTTLEHKATPTDNFIRFQHSPDGRTIASMSSKKVYLWDASTGERKVTITGHAHSVFSVAYSPDGKTIATRNGPEGDLQDAVTGISLWDAGTAKRKVTIAEHPCYIFMYSPDSSTIITSGMHGEERSQRVLTTRDGREYTLGDGRVIRLWDVNTGEHKAILEEHAYDVQSFAVSPDGSTIITQGLQYIENDGHFGRFTRLWDATTGKYKTTLVDDRNRGGPISVAYSPDSKTIAIGGNWGISLWDVVTGEHKVVLVDEATLVDHGYIVGVENLAYSPDDETIATWKDYGQEVHLWDGATGAHKTTLGHIDSGFGCHLEGFIYSPDGSTIATKSPGKVYLWNAITGECKATLIDEPIGPSLNLAYSADGSTITTWSDKVVNLWDTITAEHKMTITRHIDDISGLAYSPNGKTIATGSKDGTVLLWEIPFYKYSDMNPREIHGNWRAGWALDVHTLSSRPLPGSGYDTERTELGELVFQLKYRHDRTKIQPIAEAAAKFVKEKFAVDGHLVLPYLKAVLPIPPSDKNRDFQPVTEVAEEIGRLLSVPVRTNYLTKVKQTTPLKNLPDVASKREQLRGAFVVRSQNLKNQCVLLVDDLYDSGTTLTEVTKVLYEQGGVQHVLVLTLTRTRTGGN